jgi:hypothetical protein
MDAAALVEAGAMIAPGQVGADWVVAELVKLAGDQDSRDRLKALELLGRHFGMWPGRAEAAPPAGDSASELILQSFLRGGDKP